MGEHGIVIATNAHIAKECVLVGEVAIGSDSSVFYNSTLRGDIEPIVIKDGTNIQDNCVFHASTGSPVTVGNGVTIGHGSIIHGCEIGDNSLIGMGSIVMNGAKIGRNCLLGAGSLVTEGTQIPDGSLAYGRPAKVIRQLKEEEIASLYHSRDVYIECSRRLFGNYEERDQKAK